MRQDYKFLRKCKKLLKLFWQQRKILLYTCLSLNILRLMLWLFPFKVVRQQLTYVSAMWKAHSAPRLVAIDVIVWAVTIAGYYTPGGAKCLVRALTTQLLLSRYGYPHQLHIGVAMGQSQVLEAHAWIEYNGHVIIGGLTDLSRFKPLSSTGITL